MDASETPGNTDRTESHSVSGWIDSLRLGDRDATLQIWNRFYTRLTGFAARRLRSSSTRVADEDDVAAEVFASFFRRAEAGHFPDLRDREGLWRLLLTITERKAHNQVRHERSQKRGSGRVRGDSVFFPSADRESAGGFERIAAADPSPDDVAILNETLTELLNALTPDQSRIATLKMEGHSNRDISELAACSVATVERRLNQIRKSWSRIIDAPD